MTRRAAYGQRMTRTLWLRRFSGVTVCSLLSACEGGETRDEPNSATEIHDERNIELWGREYLDSLSFRRGILEQSLNFQENGYARLRLNEYGVSQNGSDAGWELLPEFSPMVRLFIPDQGFGIPFEPVPLLIPRSEP